MTILGCHGHGTAVQFTRSNNRISPRDAQYGQPQWLGQGKTGRVLATVYGPTLPTSHPIGDGSSRGISCCQRRSCTTVEDDPNVWSGRALQENFVDLQAAVLHQCIRPLIGACCAPGHHGYQRACVLISGQASIGPFGSPGFACAGKTEPPSRLILSQTSAGNC